MLGRPHANPTTSVLTFLPILEVAREHGVDVDVLLAREGLSTRVFESPSMRVEVCVAVRLVLAVERALPGVAIALEAAPRRTFTALGLVGLLLASGTTAREVLALLSRFGHLLHEGARIELHEEGSVASIRPVVLGVPIVVPTQLELLFATFISVGKTITRAERPPSEVRFVHSCRATVGEYERFFRCPVTFGADAYELRFPRAYLEIPLRGGSPEARDTLTLIAERALSVPRRTKSFLRSVNESAASAILDRDESLVSVARRVGTSARTLQRRLAGEGLSYERVLDELRKAMSLNLLVDARLPVTRVATKVGFANASAFTRAFRRWTGMSPAAYRSSEAYGETSEQRSRPVLDSQVQLTVQQRSP